MRMSKVSSKIYALYKIQNKSFLSFYRNFPKGIFAFGHSPSIVPLLTRLGFYKDIVGPLASNYAESASRKFHSNKVDPFGSNVAIVLYSCQQGQTDESPPGGIEWPSTLSKYMVQIFLQEQPVTLSDTEFNLIPYEDFRQKYINSMGLCNVTEICGKKAVDPQSNAGIHPLISYLILFLGFVVINTL